MILKGCALASAQYIRFFIWVFFCLQHLDTNRFRDWGVSLSYCLEYIVCYTLQLEHRKSVIIHTHCTYITQPFCIQNQSMCFRIAALETQQIITIIPVWFHCRALGFVIFWGYKCIWLEISNAPKHMLFQRIVNSENANHLPKSQIWGDDLFVKNTLPYT